MMAEKVSNLTKTCTAMPAQWEGRLEDGRYVYVRYRFGWLTVGFGTTLNDAIDDRDTFGLAHGGEMAGWMDEGEMWKLTREVISPTAGASFTDAGSEACR